MQIYFFTGGVASDELAELETRLRATLPTLNKLNSVEELSLSKETGGKRCILFPILGDKSASFDRLINVAQQFRESIYFIFISDEISASDYKRLVRTSGADWVSTKGAPQEIADILAGATRGRAEPVEAERGKPPFIVFVPSSGGVGNATLTIETGVQLKLNKRTRNKRMCLFDMDFQTSHVCDYLDIEPRLQIHDLAADPGRLDAHLFDSFVSHHSSSGLDVLGAPRSKSNPGDLSMHVLDTLFSMISQRYDLVLIDLPVPWFSWTRHILSVSDLAIVSGTHTVPGLRQISEAVEATKGGDHAPAQIAVMLNRCETGLFGRVMGRQRVKSILSHENVFFVRNDPTTAHESANTGVPITTTRRSSKIAKDIAPLVDLIAGIGGRF